MLGDMHGSSNSSLPGANGEPPVSSPLIEREAGRASTRPAGSKAALWAVAHAASLVTLALGVVAFIVAAALQNDLWAQPSLKLTIPFLVVTVAAAVVSFARGERAVILPLLGVALAAAAMVLGWFLVMGIVVVVAAIIIFILSSVM